MGIAPHCVWRRARSDQQGCCGEDPEPDGHAEDQQRYPRAQALEHDPEAEDRHRYPYAPVVAGVENDIDEIEDEVFNGAAGAPRRVYELSRG
jgi:hypothetical protein